MYLNKHLTTDIDDPSGFRLADLYSSLAVAVILICCWSYGEHLADGFYRRRRSMVGILLLSCLE